MFGGLHIEMAAPKMLGNLLESSGWTGALRQANVALPETADSFVKVSHVTRTRQAHQVTAGSLYLCLQMAYTEYQKSMKEGSQVMSLKAWRAERDAACPHLGFWSIILQLELCVLIYVRAI